MNNNKSILKGLKNISQKIGKYPDMVQGGGGNTSAKLNDEVMAIKASGYKLTQITEDSGYVKVNYQNLIDYFNNVDPVPEKDYESEYSEIIMENVVSEEKLKPSVETGFHSLLKRYVIHTHSVYANIICCTDGGENMVQDIFSNTQFDPLWIDYSHPGFDLTLVMLEKIKEYKNEYNKEPEIIFLENHGLIITNDDYEKGIKLNGLINKEIRTYLGIQDDYPEVDLKKLSDKKFKSKTPYLKEFFKKNEVSEEFFDNILYPDQLVYLEDSVAIDSEKDARINIDPANGEIIYQAKENEAQTINETLTAFIYIMDYIENNDLAVKPMPEKYINLIKNMQAEKHRKKVMKEGD